MLSIWKAGLRHCDECKFCLGDSHSGTWKCVCINLKLHCESTVQLKSKVHINLCI